MQESRTTSHVTYDAKSGEEIELAFYNCGEQHRIHGPAHVQIDPTTGTIIEEAYYCRGMRHRDGDHPALITRDAVTGQVLTETYFVEGQIHRMRGPAKIFYDAANGSMVERLHFRRGKQVRPAQPKNPTPR